MKRFIAMMVFAWAACSAFGAITRLAIDTRTGTRVARPEEPIVFSTDWSEGVTRLVLNVDGVNVLTTTTATNGVYLWKPDIYTSGAITLKHITQGVGNEELTAMFVVEEKVSAGGAFIYTPPESEEVYSVPYDWLVAAGLAKYGDSALHLGTELGATHANGYTGWEAYVAGLDPTNSASVFTATIAVTNGKVYVSWSPNLNEEEVARIYKLYGRTELGSGDWETPVQPWHRFFKVEVAMPTGAAGETSDVSGEGFVPMSDGVQLWENGPYWAECNVGASKPEEYGYYFWWGDTVGYARNASDTGWISVKDGMSFTFSSGNCPVYGLNDSQLQSGGYIDSTGSLVAAYDAATANLGAPWRMPTDAEMSALISNCTTTWITTNGVKGRLATGKGAYASRSIFLPAAGYGSDSSISSLGSVGYYWSHTSYSSNSYLAWYLYFGSSNFNQSYYRRYYGLPVRPVRGFAQ